MTAAAYIRRSAADADSPGDISRDVQEAAVLALARRDGQDGGLRYFVDWARSADEEKEARRTAFRALLTEIEEGQVSTLYAYSLDRLARSTNTFARLLKAAKERDVRVVTQREGDLSDNGNPTSWAFAFLVSFFAEFELRMAKARAQGARERREARGDVFGHPPLGWRHERGDGGRIVRVRDERDPLRDVLDAVREAGSILGACRLLASRGVPAPKGGSRWSTSTLTRIVAANAPELLPAKGVSGRRVPAQARLAQLLRCHCGTVMTPNVKRGQYYCNRGHTEGRAHGKYNLREVDVMPWIIEEAERLHTPSRVRMAETNKARRAELAAQRERIGWAVVDGHLDRDAAQERSAAIAAELAELDQAEALMVVPRIRWTWEPARLNGILRLLWKGVDLDESLRPVEATWRVPEWRG